MTDDFEGLTRRIDVIYQKYRKELGDDTNAIERYLSVGEIEIALEYLGLLLVTVESATLEDLREVIQLAKELKITDDIAMQGPSFWELLPKRYQHLKKHADS